MYHKLYNLMWKCGLLYVNLKKYFNVFSFPGGFEPSIKILDNNFRGVYSWELKDVFKYYLVILLKNFYLNYFIWSTKQSYEEDITNILPIKKIFYLKKVICFETGLAGLELKVLLSWPPECWDCRHALPHSA
jgi:hypothetical protein